MLTRRRILRDWPKWAGAVLLIGGLFGYFFPFPAKNDWQNSREKLLRLDPNNISEAVAVLDQIPDPIERGLSAELWVTQNRGHTDLSRATAICRQLPDIQAKPCERHLSSAHLQR